MRVGVYTECLLKKHTGIEWMTNHLIRGLSKAGIKIVCFHSKSNSHPRFRCEHYLFKRSIKIALYNFIASFFRYNCFKKVDLLHLSHPNFPFIFKPNVPVVVTVHDLTPLFFPKMHNLKRRIFFKYLLPRYLRKVQAIIAISGATKRDLIKYYRISPKKIKVVHNGIDFPDSVKVKKEKYILYVGTLEPRKNIAGIIKAFSKLKSEGYEYKLIIAGGKGWGYRSLFKLVKQLNLKGSVIFTGYVDGTIKWDLLRKAKVFVYPSFYEGFGIPPLEAMACGTPVVTSNVSSIPEIVGDAAVLVDPKSYLDIADGIKSVLDSTSKYEMLVKRGFERIKMFSLDKMIHNTIYVYEGVL